MNNNSENIHTLLSKAAEGDADTSRLRTNVNDESYIHASLYPDSPIGHPLSFTGTSISRNSDSSNRIWFVAGIGASYQGQYVGFSFSIKETDVEPNKQYEISENGPVRAVLTLGSGGNPAKSGTLYLEEVDIGSSSVYFKGKIVFKTTMSGTTYKLDATEFSVKKLR
ncbi:hypothetical protein D9M71_363680 [compost metagenome]